MNFSYNYFNAFFWLLLLLQNPACKEKESDSAFTQTPPAGSDNTFINPLLPSGPDPWVVQKDGYYYYTHTLGNRLGLIKTKAISQLKKETFQTIWTPPVGTDYSQNIWAPELHFISGKWYFYFAADNSQDINHRMYVLENEAADPTTGTWVFKGKIAAPTDKWAIDGTVLEYQGKLFFIWSGWRGENEPGVQQLYIAPMSNPWTISGERVLLSEPVYPWERNGLVNEGPEILKNKQGRVFLVYSASGCWTDDYALGMLTLQDGGNPLSPGDWTKNPTPVFTKNPSNNAYGPGHNSFFKSPDLSEDWIIYHANSAPRQGCGDARNPRIQKFTWNMDGTPHFGEPLPIGSRLTKPSGEIL